MTCVRKEYSKQISECMFIPQSYKSRDEWPHRGNKISLETHFLFPRLTSCRGFQNATSQHFLETQRELCVYLTWRLGISSSSNKTWYPFTATLRAAERGSAYRPSPKAEEIGNYRQGWPIIAAIGIDYSSLCKQTFIVASWVWIPVYSLLHFSAPHLPHPQNKDKESISFI